MTEKDLHKLRKQDYLQLLVAQGQEMVELQAQLDETTAELEQVTETDERLKSKLNDKDAQIEKLKLKLNDKDAQMEKLKAKLNDKDAQLDKLTGRLNEKDAQIEKLKGRLDKKDATIGELREELKNRRSGLEAFNIEGLNIEALNTLAAAAAALPQTENAVKEEVERPMGTEKKPAKSFGQYISGVTGGVQGWFQGKVDRYHRFVQAFQSAMQNMEGGEPALPAETEQIIEVDVEEPVVQPVEAAETPVTEVPATEVPAETEPVAVPEPELEQNEDLEEEAEDETADLPVAVELPAEEQLPVEAAIQPEDEEEVETSLMDGLDIDFEEPEDDEIEPEAEDDEADDEALFEDDESEADEEPEAEPALDDSEEPEDDEDDEDEMDQFLEDVLMGFGD